MNKPAAKEPSMDEILSSIRQIIADDDESAAPRRPSLQVAPDPMEAVSFGADQDNEPLELSSAQIVPEVEAAADVGFDALLADAQAETADQDAEPALVVPDDISFSPAEPETDFAELPSFNPALSVVEDVETAAEPDFSPEPEVEAAPVLSAVSIDEDRSVTEFAPEPIAFSRPSVAAASPMPDATLSADIAEGLLEDDHEGSHPQLHRQVGCCRYRRRALAGSGQREPDH
ncbi:hypothetical protein [Devosia riboflavina]